MKTITISVFAILLISSNLASGQTAKYGYIEKALVNGVYGNFERAKAELQKAIEVQEDQYKSLSGYLLEFVEDVLQERIKKQTGVHLCKAMGHLIGGKDNEAITEISVAIKIDPMYSLAYRERGAIYDYLKGEYDKALGDYIKTIELGSKKYGEYLEKAIKYVEDYDKDYRISREEHMSNMVKMRRVITRAANASSRIGSIYMTIYKDKEKACYYWKEACDIGYCTDDEKAQKAGNCK